MIVLKKINNPVSSATADVKYTSDIQQRTWLEMQLQQQFWNAAEIMVLKFMRDIHSKSLLKLIDNDLIHVFKYRSD